MSLASGMALAAKKLVTHCFKCQNRFFGIQPTCAIVKCDSAKVEIT